MNLRKSCANKSSNTFLVYISIEYVTNSVRDTITRSFNEWPCNDYNTNNQPYLVSSIQDIRVQWKAIILVRHISET